MVYIRKGMVLKNITREAQVVNHVLPPPPNPLGYIIFGSYFGVCLTHARLGTMDLSFEPRWAKNIQGYYV